MINMEDCAISDDHIYFFPLFIPDNWNFFFFWTMSMAPLSCFFVTPLCHHSIFNKAWLSSWGWKSSDQNKHIYYVNSRAFCFLLCSTHFKTEHPLLCNFFLELCQPSKTIVLTMCLVFDLTVLPDRNRLYLFLV